MKNIRLDEIKSFENIGFHFTKNDKELLAKIEKEGLVPKMGANSSNSQSKEAIDKVFFSYGKRGALKLFNTFTTLYRTANIGFFESEEHKKCIPDSAKKKDKEDTLTNVEAFEAMRQYMSDKVYLLFKVSSTKYERKLSKADLDRVNEEIKNSQMYKQAENLEEEIEGIKGNDKIEEAKKQKMISNISKSLRDITLKIRQESKAKIDSLRGKLIDSSGVFDQVDYDEAKRRWSDNIIGASNVHTKITEKDGQLISQSIMPDGIAAKNSSSPANAIDVISFLDEKTYSHDGLTAGAEPYVVDEFAKYCKMVEKYKEEGLLKKRDKDDDTLVMDLEHMEKYDGLQEFAKSTDAKISLRSKEAMQKWKAEKAKENSAQHGFLSELKGGVNDLNKAPDKQLKKIANEPENQHPSHEEKIRTNNRQAKSDNLTL